MLIETEVMPYQDRKLNWKRDIFTPGLNLYLNRPEFAMNRTLVPSVSSVDLRKSICPPIVDQGRIGSCTANAWSYLLGALQIRDIQKKMPFNHAPEMFDANQFDPISRLFIYYNERIIQGTTLEDSGATLSEGKQAIEMWGMCRESVWGYSPDHEFVKPNAAAYTEGSAHKDMTGLQIDNTHIAQIKTCLVSGYPIVYGMLVFDSMFATVADGKVSMPHAGEKPVGGHALCIMGFDDKFHNLDGSQGAFIVPNSWGVGFGDKGFMYIDYKYLTNPRLASDFWTLRD